MTGKICSGKTYAANYLRHRFGYKVLSFATGVKRYARLIFGMKKKNRRLLQDFSEKMKEIDKRVWIKQLDKELKKHKDKNVVIDDLRFPDELRYLRKKGFIIIRLSITSRLQCQRIRRTYGRDAKEHLMRLNHVSENYVDTFDVDYDIKSGRRPIFPQSILRNTVSS